MKLKPKEPCVVVTFETTTGALAMERASKAHGLLGRLIPVPRQLSAGCGMAWREPADNETAMRKVLELENIEFEDVHVLCL